jgi:LPS export ABC transporter protein LptC
VDRKSIFLVLFIFIIIALAFYFSLDEVGVVPETAPPADNSAEEKLKGVNFTVYNDQKNQRLKLISEEVDNFKSESRMELKPIKGEVYSTESGKLLYTLDGDFGTYYTELKYLEIRDNVVLASEEYHILADELDYDMQQNYLEGRGSVKITGSEFKSFAEAFNSNLNLNDLELSKKSSPERAKIIFDELPEDSKTEEPNDE